MFGHTYAIANPSVRSYPERRADPYNRALIAPTAIAPIDASAPKASIFIAPRVASHTAMIPASGMRFGRIRIATAAAAPAAPALTTVPPSAPAIAIAHAAAAGTSLIGAIIMNSIAGLVATSHAAARPTAGRSIRHPIA